MFLGSSTYRSEMVGRTKGLKRVVVEISKLAMKSVDCMHGVVSIAENGNTLST